MLREDTWDIHIADDGDTLAVRPSGELDMNTWPLLLGAFGRVAEHRRLLCDLSAITFMDSSGVRGLIEVSQREPERFVLAGTSAPVEQLLELTGTAGWFQRAQQR